MRPIYHITHFANLVSMVNQGGICCDSIEIAGSLATVDIAHENIKARRRNRRVNVGPLGTLADYAPFYFAPRSPMLNAIHNDAVEGYTDGQNPIVHLVVYVEDIVASSIPFVFTDGHAEMEVSGQFTDLTDLQKIDWEVMEARYWASTNTDPGRKQRRQAEFLVYQICPWDLIKEIGVINSQVQAQVIAVLGHFSKPPITIHKDWYY